MNDRTQAAPPRRGGAHDPDFEDGPNLSVSRPRQGVPIWVWLAIGIPVVFAAICSGLLLIGLIGWVAYEEPSRMPAPTYPPMIERLEPAKEP
ncbi:MAG: hypothetical protein JNM56_05385 [Planctomycetia bacterium]|nr:hypothetical protein [Planctomycetia bacterium]